MATQQTPLAHFKRASLWYINFPHSHIRATNQSYASSFSVRPWGRKHLAGSVAEWLERQIWNRRSRVQIPFWPLADVVLGSPKFKFSSMLVNSQLVCLPPVGILNQVMFIYHYLFTLVLKSPDGEWPITYTFTFTYPSRVHSDLTAVSVSISQDSVTANKSTLPSQM